MTDETTQPHFASKATGRQHDQIAQSLVTLERALGGAAPGREAEWKHRAGAALAVVIDLLRQHVETAEGEDGLIAQLEIAQGHTRDATIAKTDHRQMLEESSALLDDLAGGGDLAVEDARERAARLVDLLRKHRWREADLILDVFNIDLGHGD